MDDASRLKELIEAYQPGSQEEKAYKDQMLDLIKRRPDCLLRSCLEGHFTASAFVLDPGKAQVLLIHHKKLDKWLQPGGHADGNGDLNAVAKLEVWEETGLETSDLLPGIFDIDIHEIPARGEVPQHLHYDIRYLLLAKSTQTQMEEQEILDISWVSLANISQYTKENSILRMKNKAAALIEGGYL